MRFVFFHYVLFADRAPRDGDGAIGPDIAAGPHPHRQASPPEPGTTDIMAMSSSAN
jgi:hypothetical protein